MHNAALNAAFELKAIKYKISEAKNDADCASIMASFLDKRGFAITRKAPEKPKEPEESPFERQGGDARYEPNFVALESHTTLAKASSSIDYRRVMDAQYIKEYVPHFVEERAKEAAWQIVKNGYYHVDTMYDAASDVMHFEVSIPIFNRPVNRVRRNGIRYMSDVGHWRPVLYDKQTGAVAGSTHMPGHSVSARNPYLNNTRDTTALITGA